MYLTNCTLCSNTLKSDNELNKKYICSNSDCNTHFEVMDVKNDGQEETIIKYYKLNNNGVEMISHCAHCEGELVERCSMPTIGTRGKKRTTILTCSDPNCNAEYHVTDDVELKEKYQNGDSKAINFRTIEIY